MRVARDLPDRLNVSACILVQPWYFLPRLFYFKEEKYMNRLLFVGCSSKLPKT